MCDTLVALGPATADGSVLFGKNSDREPDEVQNVEVIPGGSHGPGEKVKCTWLEIPQAERTFTVLLCQPFWMFGAEMGANECGVVIGNEAVFTKEKPDRVGLTGMDLVRLALERSRSAREALETIIGLLEEHGQGGNCGYRKKLYYMNSFLIADPEEAYVLETVKRWWAWKKVEQFWTISNIFSLTDDFDECSPGLVERAVKKGWCKNEEGFSLRDCYSDFLITRFAHGAARQSCTRSFLAEREGKLDTRAVMEALRDHGPDPEFRPDRTRMNTVCMHAGNSLTRPSQTVGSLVARLGKDGRRAFYVTGASAPCLSPFFPVSCEERGLPEGYRPGGAHYDPESFWWRSERLHRKALFRFQQARAALKPQVEKLETRMVKEIESLNAPPSPDEITAWFHRADSLKKEWGKELESMKETPVSWLYRRYWRRLNRKNRVLD